MRLQGPTGPALAALYPSLPLHVRMIDWPAQKQFASELAQTLQKASERSLQHLAELGVDEKQQIYKHVHLQLEKQWQKSCSNAKAVRNLLYAISSILLHSSKQFQSKNKYGARLQPLVMKILPALAGTEYQDHASRILGLWRKNLVYAPETLQEFRTALAPPHLASAAQPVPSSSPITLPSAASTGKADNGTPASAKNKTSQADTPSSKKRASPADVSPADHPEEHAAVWPTKRVLFGETASMSGSQKDRSIASKDPSIDHGTAQGGPIEHTDQRQQIDQQQHGHKPPQQLQGQQQAQQEVAPTAAQQAPSLTFPTVEALQALASSLMTHNQQQKKQDQAPHQDKQPAAPPPPAAPLPAAYHVPPPSQPQHSQAAVLTPQPLPPQPMAQQQQQFPAFPPPTHHGSLFPPGIPIPQHAWPSFSTQQARLQHQPGPGGPAYLPNQPSMPHTGPMQGPPLGQWAGGRPAPPAPPPPSLPSAHPPASGPVWRNPGAAAPSAPNPPHHPPPGPPGHHATSVHPYARQAQPPPPLPPVPADEQPPPPPSAPPDVVSDRKNTTESGKRQQDAGQKGSSSAKKSRWEAGADAAGGGGAQTVAQASTTAAPASEDEYDPFDS